MIFQKTKFKGVFQINCQPIVDFRGSFMRTFCIKEYLRQNIKMKIVQVNRSYNKKKGIIRGIHFQKNPKSEDKIIEVIKGKIFDVIVDLRPKSNTYKQWFSIELSNLNNKMIYIPKGCGHGFQTLEDNCEIIYYMSEYYFPEYAFGIRWNDSKINIRWPLKDPILSDKDKNWPLL